MMAYTVLTLKVPHKTFFPCSKWMMHCGRIDNEIWERLLINLCSRALLPVAIVLFATNVLVYADTTDDVIESASKESYFFKNYLQHDNIVVESKDGIVTLKGFVAEENHKALAQEIVESIVGVVTVDNQLQIKEEIPENSDILISSRVKLAIISHRTLRGIDVRFTVVNGNVTLYGKAASTIQIDLTTEYVRDIDGVKDVKNEMDVFVESAQTEITLNDKTGAGEKRIGEKTEGIGKEIGDKTGQVVETIDDSSITAIVKATLMYHRSTRGLNTKVSTHTGVVTVSGTVKSESERELVTKIVQDVHGVRDVINTIGLDVVQ